MVHLRLSSLVQFFQVAGVSLLLLYKDVVAQSGNSTKALIVSMLQVTEDWDFCGSCQDKASSCPVKFNSGMYIDGSCLPSPEGSSMTTIIESDNIICITLYSDDGCQQRIDDLKECDYYYRLGCNETDPGNEFLIFEDFCIESATPSGEFQTPLYTSSLADTAEDCASGTDMVTSLQSDGPSYCTQTPSGSVTISCNGTNEEWKYFLDRDCSQTDFAVQIEGEGKCNTVDLGGPYSWNLRTGCGNYQYFCKDFLELGSYTYVNDTPTISDFSDISEISSGDERLGQARRCPWGETLVASLAVFLVAVL